MTTETPTQTLFGESFYFDAPYQQSYSALSIPMPTDTPGCFNAYIYGATAGRVVGGYAQARYCVCGNEKLTLAINNVDLVLNQTIAGQISRNPAGVDSNGIYTPQIDFPFNLDNQGTDTSQECGMKMA